MDKHIAEQLVDELSQRKDIISVDRELFLQVLLPIDINTSTQFNKQLLQVQQLNQELGQMYFLSLHQVYVNKNATRYVPSHFRKIVENVESVLNHSDEFLTKRIRQDEGLVQLMKSSEYPYSLLGRFRTMDTETADNRLETITKPILIIPGVNDERIKQWEDTHSRYEKSKEYVRA